MKKILSILGTITLFVTSTTSLVACNNIRAENPPEKSHWKYVSSVLEEGNTEKWYCGIFKKNNKWNIIKWKGNQEFFSYYYDKVYRWDGYYKPKTPNIDMNKGKILDWKL